MMNMIALQTVAIRSLAVRGLAVAALALAVAGCARMDGDDRGDQPIPAKLVSEMSAKGMSPADPIMIRIYKQESELEVWKRDSSGRYALLKTYPMCRWSGKLGPKTREGDRQAPEGFYTVSRAQLNPRSSYYLSFNLGYPNPLEKALGYSGAALMVHGACTSAGCYAMTDGGIAEVYPVAREAIAAGQPGFQVQALPFRMTPENLAHHRADPNMPYWRNLKEGTDLFAVTRQPPKVGACGGRYRFAAAGSPIDVGSTDPLAPCPAVSDPAVDGLVAARRTHDEQVAASLAATQPSAPLAYVDGGMNPVFRDMLRRSGPEKMAAQTARNIPVSEPQAALADPYVPTRTASAAESSVPAGGPAPAAEAATATAPAPSAPVAAPIPATAGLPADPAMTASIQ